MTSTPDEPLKDFETPISEQSGLCGGPGQISCDEANELIQSFLDREVDPVTGERLHEHLGTCPPCEQEFFVYQRIVEALGRCRPDLPADTAARLHNYCSSLCNDTDVNLDVDEFTSEN